MISVWVEPYFRAPVVAGQPRFKIEVEEGTTIKGLLVQLAEAYGPELEETFVDRVAGEIKSHYMILVNGIRILAQESGGIILNNGDVVSILTPFRGG